MQSDPELLLKIKTARALVPELTAAVRAQHPYDEPEVVALDAAGGSESYLKVRGGVGALGRWGVGASPGFASGLWRRLRALSRLLLHAPAAASPSPPALKWVLGSTKGGA